MKLLHLGDLHLDSAMGAHLPGAKAAERRKELLSISTDCVPEHNFPKAELDIMHNIIEKYETKRTRI
ncbi:MAG: hypothetical protein MJ078_00645 [Clostridia bacterium]|nr:hypothetical protein [Clostridia bacterium]